MIKAHVLFGLISCAICWATTPQKAVIHMDEKGSTYGDKEMWHVPGGEKGVLVTNKSDDEVLITFCGGKHRVFVPSNNTKLWRDVNCKEFK